MSLGTILILLLLLAVIAGSIYTIYRDKKKGSCTCGGSCEQCGACKKPKT